MATQNSIGAPTPFAVDKGGTGNATALTDRQVLLGKTSTPTALVPTTLLAGAGITLTDGVGTLTIAAPATDPSAVVLPDPTSSQTFASNTTYICTNTSGGVTTFTLPVSPVAGEFYAIIGGGSQGWTVAQRASQQIFIGNVSTTIGTGGSDNSTTTGGSATENITIYCQTPTLFLGLPSGANVNLI